MLAEANETIYGDRFETYGESTATLTRIGIMWGAQLNQDPIPAHDVSLMMVSLNLIRISETTTHRDSYVDAAGYTALAADAALGLETPATAVSEEPTELIPFEKPNEPRVAGTLYWPTGGEYVALRGDRRHLLLADHNGDPVCRCRQYDPAAAGARSVEQAVSMINIHIGEER